MKGAKKVWFGSKPKCDLDGGHKITDEFVDGMTTMGPWAMMCPLCAIFYGYTGDEGLFHKYKLQAGEWVRVK